MKKKQPIKRSNRHYELQEGLYIAQSKCFKSGIFISPECVTNGSKWRIVIEIGRASCRERV